MNNTPILEFDTDRRDVVNYALHITPHPGIPECCLAM